MFINDATNLWCLIQTQFYNSQCATAVDHSVIQLMVLVF